MLKKWWVIYFSAVLESETPTARRSFSPAGPRDFFYHRTLKSNFSVAGFRLLLKLCSRGFRVQVEMRRFSLLLRQNQQVPSRCFQTSSCSWFPLCAETCRRRVDSFIRNTSLLRPERVRPTMIKTCRWRVDFLKLSHKANPDCERLLRYILSLPK